MPPLLGVTLVTLGGVLISAGGFPIKLMHKFQFEQWFFIQSVISLAIIPWVATLIFCPNAFLAFQTVEPSLLLRANLCSLGWGVASVLCGLCLVRIGFSLTGGILTGLGTSIGVTVPMVLKGSGIFGEAPDVGSPAGRTVLVGVAIMLVGVVFTVVAGFGCDRALNGREQRSGSFFAGLIMAVVSGILLVGLSFSFVYSQGPIVKAMKAQGAGDIPANFAVWAVGLIGGVLITMLYPAYLMTRKKSWCILTNSWREMGWSLFMGIVGCLAVVLLGKGMLFLGAMGASVGFGIQQAAQLFGNMGVGFISGEWRGVRGTPLNQMYFAILALLLASIIMGYGNSLARG